MLLPGPLPLPLRPTRATRFEAPKGRGGDEGAESYLFMIIFMHVFVVRGSI